MAVRGLLIDLDGTVFVGNALLPGALEALERLDAQGIPLLFATNMTRRPRRILLERLREMGLDLAPEKVYTAPMAAAIWLRSQGHERIFSCMARATLEDLPGFEFVGPQSRESRAAPVAGAVRPGGSRAVDAVLVGDLGDAWSYPLLNAAFRHLKAGSQLVAVQRNLYWQDDDGLALDAGPFITALETAAGVEATLVGKPAAQFFGGAAERLGLSLSEIAMIGDDLHSDVGGAQGAGALGVLVRTGKYRPGDLESRAVRPDVVLDSIAQLPEWLSS